VEKPDIDHSAGVRYARAGPRRLRNSSLNKAQHSAWIRPISWATFGRKKSPLTIFLRHFTSGAATTGPIEPHDAHCR
jgi:hypothetical protein